VSRIRRGTSYYNTRIKGTHKSTNGFFQKASMESRGGAARGRPPFRAGHRGGLTARGGSTATRGFAARWRESTKGRASHTARGRRSRPFSGALPRPIIDGAEEWVENINFYRVGGYHPVHLHDSLNDGQYRVIDKLGYGGYSTVWLCRDTTAASPRYVAVKIIKGGQSGKECRELIMSNALKARGIDNDPWESISVCHWGNSSLKGRMEHTLPGIPSPRPSCRFRVPHLQ
jgi:hypothetical protein